MTGKVIQSLRQSPLAVVLSDAELRVFSNCGNLLTYRVGETILDDGGLDEHLFLLREGSVSLHLSVWTESSQCSGEAEFNLNSPGDVFGWAAWMRPEFLRTAAFAVEPVSLAAFDLRRLGDTYVYLKAREKMLQILYGYLQQQGLCPPNIHGWLKMKRHLFAGEIHESGMG